MFFNIYNNIFYNVNSNRKPTKRIVRLHFVETVVLAESGIGVVHREQDSRKIEHCDARGQLAHVYKATLAVLHLDIVARSRRCRERGRESDADTVFPLR